MKRNDIILIASVVVIALVFVLRNYIINSNTGDLVAKIYYQDNLIETIDLSEAGDEVQTFEVEATNGLVVIEYKHNEIRVSEETSNHNLCSIQGWTSSVLQPIICLPNELFIVLESAEGSDSGIDIVV